MRALPDEDRIAGLMQFVLERLEGRDRVCVEVNRSSRAVLRLCEVDGAAVEMHLSPRESVLLR